jgi:glycerol-3-phosphate dehydrogenase
VRPSQGVHVVLDRSFLNGDTALMIPKTPDGRVLFAVPWHGHLLVGTTDTPLENSSLEPRPLAAEIDFILDTAGQPGCAERVRRPAAPGGTRQRYRQHQRDFPQP